jgi:hypothetical protein
MMDAYMQAEAVGDLKGGWGLQPPNDLIYH